MDMSLLPLSQQKSKTWIADPGRRRSMRVLLSIPVTVSGKSNSKDFTEETRTLVVNAHGALLSLAAPVTAGQTICMANKPTRHESECRVVYVGSIQAGKSQIGVEFLEPAPSFWQIDFPPEDWVPPES